MQYQTEQEEFWAGDFGDEYISRNQSDQLLAANLNYFSNALRNTNKIGSVIEFGANIGMNMRALKALYPQMELNGIEINQKAYENLAKFIGSQNAFHTSIFDFSSEKKFDLTFTKGVLIHINPDLLEKVYEKLYEHSNKYILVSEYFNPSPVEIPYRGHSEKLFKRDFCGDLMDKYSDLKLVDYGFNYSRDTYFPQDNLNWFLLQKEN